ncbi:MAG: phosphotransferase [Acidimicrobiales bacterium]
MELPPDPDLGPVGLTDPVAVAGLLAPSLAPGAEPPRLRLRYLEHEVGRSLLAWYRAETGPTATDVVVSRGRRSWDASPLDAAGRFGTSPPADAVSLLEAAGVVRPATDAAGTTVAWYPFDPGLPGLACDPGGHLPPGAGRPTGPWRRLAWMPQQRAVLASGDVVVKMEAESERLRAGVQYLDLLRPVVRTPEVLAVDERAGVYVQELLAGRPLGPPDALAQAAAAGALVGRIVAAGGDDPGARWPVPRVEPPDLLSATVPVRRLVAHAAPELGARVERVATGLAAGAVAGPVATAPLRLTHGDFNAGQLVARPRGQLGLVDTDTLCLAPHGQDLATYATNLLAGRPGDLAAVDAALAGLEEGYGPAPAALPWLVAVAALRRLDRPIRRYKSTWHRRVAQLLADVEILAART